MKSFLREFSDRRRRLVAMKSRWLTSALCIAGMVAIHCSTQEPGNYHISDEGINNRLKWEVTNATIAEGSALLNSPDGLEPSQIRQVLRKLKPNTEYRLSVKARALNTPTSQLSVDLFLDETYDSPDQELIVEPSEIEPIYRTYHRTISSGSFSDQPYVRVFTFSTVPVEVDEIVLAQVGH